MKRILFLFALLSVLKMHGQFWSGSNTSTYTSDEVNISIPQNVSNTITIPHLSLIRNVPPAAPLVYLRQPYLEIFKYNPGFPPMLPPTSDYIFTLNDEGFAGFGYKDATSPLHVHLPIKYNQKSFHFSTVGSVQNINRQLFYVNRATEGFYSKLVRLNDHALIFSDGENITSQTVTDYGNTGEPIGTTFEQQQQNVNSGFVIAPWYTPLNNSDFRGLRIDANGNVGIGTYNTFGNKLAINGTMTCREINMDVNYPWPDYVFTSKYKLMSLYDLDKYIKTYHHLPNIPSAAEVACGYKVGEVQIKLLEKLEEMTLYIIELEKRIEDLEKLKK